MSGFALASGGWMAALVALGLVYGLYRIYRRQQDVRQPAVWYSRTADLKTSTPSLRITFANLPQWLSFFALGCFLLAWLDPRVPWSSTPDTKGPTALHQAPIEGLALYLLLDQSGSMNRISPSDPLGPTKLERLKAASSAFIETRPNDLIGLIAFARAATVLAPLTLDHANLLEQLRTLQPLNDPEQDGTGIGYAIFKTVNLITATREFAKALTADGKPAYAIRNAVIVLVTDGFQNTNAMDKGKWMRSMGMEEAAQYAKANNIKLYLVNIEPALAKEEFAPHRHLLERVTDLTGGKLFLASGPQELQQIYTDINQLERSSIPAMAPPPDHAQAVKPSRQIYDRFLYLGLLALGTAVILSTTLLSRLP